MAQNSLTFNGASTKIALTALSGLSAGFSFVCWVKCFAPTTAAQGLICNGTSTSDRACMTLIGQTPPGFIGAGYYNGSVFSGVKSTDGPLQVQKWYHVAYTYNGATGALYLNTAPQRGPTNPSTAATAALTIGCRNDSSLFFPGRMRGVAIFKRAITRYEVKILYNATLNRQAPINPAAIYVLD
jgi:hypothetical protein